METVQLILVGGFLGAGKTTLMAQAGRLLAARGRRVGFITNDQAAQLVDTEFLLQTGLEVKEVAGACFCCKFDELVLRTEQFDPSRQPEILITEPVGSCTDLSATVLQPLKKFYGDRFRVAPFTVVVDPSRLRQALSPQASVFSETVLYIYAKQLEEADIIVLNKVDELSDAERGELEAALAKKYPASQVVALSARSGEGLERWVDLVLKHSPAAQRILEIDYDMYAEGEAMLGWLNAGIKLQAGADTDWRALAFDILRAFKDQFRALNAEVAHLKLYLSSSGTGLVGNLTSTRGMPFVLVQGTAAVTRDALLILNARVHIQPEALRTAAGAVLDGLRARGISCDVSTMDCFSPGRPNPTHRFSEVIV